MSRESNQVTQSQVGNSANKAGVVDQTISFVRESGWLLALFGLDFTLAVLGFAIDRLAGPLTPENELLHQMSALLGAASVVLFATLIALLLAWVGLLLNERRYR
jgi:urea transporter